MKKNRYKIFLYAAVFTSVALIFILFPGNDNERNELKIELIKNLIQLSLIVIIGGILVHEYTLDRDKDKKQDELKKDLYLAMIASYFKVKKVRRVLEAGVKNKDHPADMKILYPVYEAQIRELNETQLEYESHREQLCLFIKADGFRNKEIGHQLKDNAGIMERYLDKIVNTYQKSESDNEIYVSKIKELNDFIFDTKSFKKGFSYYHHSSINLFLSEMLNVKQIPVDSNAKKISP